MINLHELIEKLPSYATNAFGIEDGPWRIDARSENGTAFAYVWARDLLWPDMSNSSSVTWEELLEPSAGFTYLGEGVEWRVSIAAAHVVAPTSPPHRSEVLVPVGLVRHAVFPKKLLDAEPGEYRPRTERYHQPGTYRISAFRRGDPPAFWAGYLIISPVDGSVFLEAFFAEHDDHLPWPRRGTLETKNGSEAPVDWTIAWQSDSTDPDTLPRGFSLLTWYLTRPDPPG